MSNLSEILHMGGYAFYIWWSYGIVAAVLIGNIISSAYRHKRLLRHLQRQQAREQSQSASTVA